MKIYRSEMKGKAGMLTQAARRALTDLCAKDAELTYSKGGGYWIGYRRIACATANSLLRLCLATCTYGHRADYSLYEINEDGRKLLADPKHVPLIVKAMKAQI